jgi:protoheme IX farnesyltransferase
MIPGHRFRRPTEAQFTTLLAVTTVAVYATIAFGAAVASSSAGTCSEWPICYPTADSALSVGFVLAVGHRTLTALAGLLLVAVLLAARAVDLDRRARYSLLGAGIAFPVQIGIGAVVVLADPAYAAELHLAVAAAVFLLLLTALSWALEDGERTRDAETLRVGPGVGEPATETDTGEPSSGEHSTVEANGESTTSARFRAYLELTKPRLMWLLCLLALAGMALATTTGTWPAGSTVAATLAGGVLAIGASGTFNHLFERERDSRMERTADRPVATAEIPARNAAAFGLALAALSIAVMVAFVNPLAAGLTVVAILYYSVVYTVVLKPNTSWNIAIGGGSGALPALIGWVAVTGSVGLSGLLLSALVVVWTPAHFYNLAIVYREDYARGGYPMFPVVAGVAAARRRILLTLGGTLLVTASLVVTTPLGPLFATAAVLAGAVFLATVVTQCRVRTREATMRSFYASNAYLGVVLLAVVVETLLLVP